MKIFLIKFHFYSHNDNNSEKEKKHSSRGETIEWQLTHVWCRDDEANEDETEWSFVDHTGGSRAGLTNVDESDQPSGDGGNVNDGNIGESESVVRNEIPRKEIFLRGKESKSVEGVGVGENHLCTGDREHDDWDDDHKSPSYKSISLHFSKGELVLLTAKLEQ